MVTGLQLTQKELIAMAFAGDNVTADFEAEKEAEAENELPKLEAPSTLPGWGAWASSQREPEWLAAAKLKVEKYVVLSSTVGTLRGEIFLGRSALSLKKQFTWVLNVQNLIDCVF